MGRKHGDKGYQLCLHQKAVNVLVGASERSTLNPQKKERLFLPRPGAEFGMLA